MSEIKAVVEGFVGAVAVVALMVIMGALIWTVSPKGRRNETASSTGSDSDTDAGRKPNGTDG